MPQLIHPNEVKVVTDGSECTVHIVLELNINVRSDGRVAVTGNQPEKVETEWVIPQFSSTKKVKFGQKGE